MPKKPNAPRPEETYSLFTTQEPFKATSKRLGISPNTLRGWWIEHFGQEAFEARGKLIQAKGAALSNESRVGKAHQIREVVVPCSSCGGDVTVNLLQKARSKTIVCVPCEESSRGVDQHCPVCGVGCVGEKGLASHMVRPEKGDVAAHAQHLSAQEAALWEGKEEGRDFVVCRLCGVKETTLGRHLKAAHGVTAEQYRMQFPGIRIVSEGITQKRSQSVTKAHRDYPRKTFTRIVRKAPREKGPPMAREVRVSSLKGRTLSPETRAKMSANAGRWAKGLTKETDPRLAAMAEKRMGQPSWSKGLTKANHPSLQQASEKQSAIRLGVPNDAARLDLSPEVFLPYLDETGAIDRRMMAEELDICEPTLTKYMELHGLRLSTKYMAARIARDTEAGRFHEMSRKSAELTTIRLTIEQLEPYKLKNGKVFLARAMRGLGHVYQVIKRECDRHGIPTHTHLVKQALCLEAVAKVLGGASYHQEWRFRKFTNPVTNHMFRFDGYFPDLKLLAEFQGYHHYTFPNVFHKDEAAYDASVERDRQKALQVRASGEFKFLVVREDEPYADEGYLRGRLIDEGVLSPGK